MTPTEDEARAFLAELGVESDERAEHEGYARTSFRLGWGQSIGTRSTAAAGRRLSWSLLGRMAGRRWREVGWAPVFEVLWLVFTADGPLLSREADTRSDETLPRADLTWAERTSEIVDGTRDDTIEVPRSMGEPGVVQSAGGGGPRVVLTALELDRAVTERLHDRLGAAGMAPWCEWRDLAYGARWDEAIPAAIRDAAVVLVLVTAGWPALGRRGADYYASEKVALAIEVAQRSGGLRVIAVLLDGVSTERVPFGLRRTRVLPATSQGLDAVVDAVARAVEQGPVVGGAVGGGDAAAGELAEAVRHRDAMRSSGAPPAALAAVEERVLVLKRSRRQRRAPMAGVVLAGRWSLIDRAGRGGFAEVWRAWDQVSGAYVAVKILHGQFNDSADRIERFSRGARQMARLDHPAVVRIVEPPHRADGFHFFVMEWLPGGDLQAAVLDGCVERDAALTGLCRIADALAAAHAVGVVHRDIKPANILLDAGGEARLADFDLVRAGDTTGGTRTGGLGTFVYAAPEAMEDASRVGPAVDVYGLGMSALFVMLGRPLPRMVLRDPARVLDGVEVSAALRAVVLQAVEWEPERRYPSAAAFAVALRQALASDDSATTLVDAGVAPFVPAVDITAPAAGARVEAVGWRPALVFVPPGVFLMGSPDGEEGRRDNEGPQHWVTLTRGLWVAETVVTGFQLRGGGGGLDRLPAVSLSWFEAVEFCNTLSRAEGLRPAYVDGVLVEADGYRLPTEAEWEYACRAGTTARFCSGDGIEGLSQVAFYRGNSARQPQPVGRMRPNGWGLYDMHGNCREWCNDWYGPYGAGRVTDPQGAVSGRKRVVRGGAWASAPRGVRSAFRDAVSPDKASPTVGFRVVRPAL